MKLAHEYKIPRRYLQRMISSEDFTEEVAFYNLEPWDDASWHQTSLLASMYFNANKRKGAASVEADHFVPKTRESKRQSPAEIAHRLKTFVRSYNKSNHG